MNIVKREGLRRGLGGYVEVGGGGEYGKLGGGGNLVGGFVGCWIR